MKNFKKILASVLAIATLGSLATVPLNANAVAKLLGYDTEGNEIWGGYYDVLVGFDDDGDPIIEQDIPDDAYQYEYDEDGNLIVVTVIPETAVVVGDSDDGTTIGDSDGGNTIDNSGSGIGVSTVTCVQGDVNLDGYINGLDLVLLKKYILGLI